MSESLSPPQLKHREYSVFISYRHADNKEPGRQWATWLHQTLETYDVPPDLVGTKNARGEIITDGLYPVFRDEDELPADAELSTPINNALRSSRYLIVICSPAAVDSRFVNQEIQTFKALGKADRVLAVIIRGEPNAADDPAKCMGGVTPADECFPLALRRRVNDSGEITTQIAEPIGADFRHFGTEEGWTTPQGYGEFLERVKRLHRNEIKIRMAAYAQQCTQMKLKIIAGVLGVPLGELTRRDQAYQLQRARQRQRTVMRVAAALAVLLCLAVASGVTAWVQLKKTGEALEESRHQEGVAWLERANKKAQEHDGFAASLMAARAVGFQGYGRPIGDDTFSARFPELLRPNPALSAEVAEFADSAIVGKPIWSSPKLSSPVLCTGYSPDGATLAAGGKVNTVWLWDVATGKLKAAIDAHVGSVDSVSFSPDGQTLASAGEDKAVRLWDAATGKMKSQIDGHTSSINSICFSPDGASLATGCYDGGVRIWDIASGKLKAKIKDSEDEVSGVSFSPDGSLLASACLYMVVRVWDVASGIEKVKLEGHNEIVKGPGIGSANCVCFSPDGLTLASGSGDGSVLLWDVATGKMKPSLKGHKSSVLSICFSPDGSTLASGGQDNATCLWAPATGALKAKFGVHSNMVTALNFSPDGATLLTGSWDTTVMLWDVAGWKQQARLCGHSDTVISVCFSPNGKLLASKSADCSVRLWDVAAGRQAAQLDKRTYSMNAVLFSPDGALLASERSGDIVELWEVAERRLKTKLDGKTEYIYSLAFSPDSALLATGGRDKIVRLWDVESGKQKAELAGHDSVVRGLNFSPDGTTLAVASTGTSVRLWDVAMAKEKAKLVGHPDETACVRFSPDGATLASGSGDIKTSGSADKAPPGSDVNSVRLWDVATGKEKAKLLGHTDEVTDVSFSPDGTTLASVSYDQTVRLWDVASAMERVVFRADSVQIPGWVKSTLFAVSGSHRAAVIGNDIILCDTSIELNLSAYLAYFEIQRGQVMPIGVPGGMPYLNVNPYSHIGILRSGKPPEETDRLLFWRYCQAGNKNSAGIVLKRLPFDKFRIEAQSAFYDRFISKSKK